MSKPQHDLEDPQYAAFAWARFRKILWWMTAVAALAAVVAVLAMRWSLGSFYLHVSIATALGAFLTVWLTAVLMGLMFLSSGSGHDSQVKDPLAGEVDIGD